MLKFHNTIIGVVNTVIIISGSMFIKNGFGLPMEQPPIFFYGFPFRISWQADTTWNTQITQSPHVYYNFAFWLIVLLSAYWVILKWSKFKVLYDFILLLLLLSVLVNSFWSINSPWFGKISIVFLLLMLFIAVLGGVIYLCFKLHRKIN